jgi:protein-S-isoprenylcysteine O-methyltransferase Ste14
MGNAQSKHGGAKVGFPPPFVFLLLTLGGAALQRWLWPLTIAAGSWLRVGAGSSIGLGGVALVLSARLWFTRTGQHPAPWLPSPELLVQGIYHHTRNPMYVGITLFQLGLGVALDNSWIAMLAPLSLLIVHFLAVRPEEAYLSERFGESYRNYTATVRRYL